jgi:hypothetical protein
VAARDAQDSLAVQVVVLVKIAEIVIKALELLGKVTREVQVPLVVLAVLAVVVALVEWVEMEAVPRFVEQGVMEFLLLSQGQQ